MRRALALAVAFLALTGAGAAQAQQSSQPPQRDVTLANETDQILQQFFAAPAGAAQRGPDRLGAEVVPPGGSFRARLGRTRDCLFDLRAIFQDGSEEERRRVDICRNTRIVFGDPSLPWLEVEVQNGTRNPLRELYASTRGAEAWGPDRLGDAVLDPGGTFRMRLRTRDCVFAVRAVYADDREEVREGVDLCADRRLTLQRMTRRITLVNRHLAVVQEAYLSGSAEDDWGQDRLGSEVLSPGAETEIETEGDCEADLRVVFPNGGAEERREVNVCETTRIVIRPGWVVAERLDEEGSVAPVPHDAALPGGGEVPGGLRLRNASRVPIVELYTDPAGAPRGEDRLGVSILGAGETIEILPTEPRACTVDLTAIFRDGREVRRSGVDLCAGEETDIE